MFELQCLSLRKDSKMYKERMEAILQQMEEVAIERDQVGASPPTSHVAGQGQRGGRSHTWTAADTMPSLWGGAVVKVVFK